MTTRESMRRELRDLAKLAETMGHTNPPAPPKPQRPDLPRPPMPSSISVTVPPSVQSIPPAALASRSSAPRQSRGRGAVASAAVVGLTFAIVGGAALGRTLAHRTAPPAAAARAPALVATPLTPVLRPVTQPAVEVTPPQTSSANARPAVAAVTPVVTAPAAPAPVAAPRHVAAVAPHRVLSKATVNRPVASSPPPPPTPAAVVPAPASTPKDPLEDAILKAVAAQK